MTADELASGVLAELIARASAQGCHGEHDENCMEPESDRHPEDWCNYCLMGAAAKQLAALALLRDAWKEEAITQQDINHEHARIATNGGLD